MSQENEKPGSEQADSLADETEVHLDVTDDEAVESTAESQLHEAEAKAASYYEEAVRIRAEMENMRKRMARDVEKAHKFALEKMMNDLIPVLDSMEKGLEAINSEADLAQVREGSELTFRMLGKAMQNHGLVEIDPIGQPFNPELHEAMAMQPDAEKEPDTVLMVIQKGYMLNDRLVRPARVVVAKAP